MPACCQRRGEVQDHLRLHQFSARRHCRACRLSHHFDSFCGGHLLLRMHAQQVFSALFKGVLNTIACICRRGVRGVFSAGVRLALSFVHGKCLPIFYRGLMCMCCVCVRTLMHTHCMWGTRMWAPVSGRDTWRARQKYRCTVVIVYIYTVRCTKYTCMYICWATGRSLD